MRKSFLWSVTVAFLAAAVFPVVALGRTTVLTGSRCNPGCSELVGVYAFRPRQIVLYDAYGGGLKLHWTHWRTRSATGVGSSFSAGAGGHSTAHVRVRLTRSLGGHFTLMRIHFTHVKVYSETGQVSAGRNSTEVLEEAFENGPEWSRVE